MGKRPLKGAMRMGKRPSKVKSKRAGGEELVLTPGGWRLKSKTFKVEPGHHVAVQDGSLRVIRTSTGEVVADLGRVAKTRQGGRPGPLLGKTLEKKK